MTVPGHSACRPSSFTHPEISSAVAPFFMPLPLTHTVFSSVSFFSAASLLPKPEELDVAKGITIFPDRSTLSRNVRRIFGACPPQIG